MTKYFSSVKFVTGRMTHVGTNIVQTLSTTLFPYPPPLLKFERVYFCCCFFYLNFGDIVIIGIFLLIISDIDECTSSIDDCHKDAQCSNTDGAFTCNCNAGFTGDGRQCTGVIPWDSIVFFPSLFCFEIITIIIIIITIIVIIINIITL